MRYVFTSGRIRSLRVNKCFCFLHLGIEKSLGQRVMEELIVPLQIRTSFSNTNRMSCVLTALAALVRKQLLNLFLIMRWKACEQ